MFKHILFLSAFCLVTLGFNLVGSANSSYDVALRKAILNSDLETAQQAIDNGANINFIEKDYSDNPLGIAISNENFEMVALLLKNGANPNTYIDGNGVFNSTPLIKAIARQKPAIVTLLIDAGANVNLPVHKYFQPEIVGISPLMQAITAPYTKETMNIFNYLLSKDVDINQATSENYTALMAASHGKFSVYKQHAMITIAEELLKRGANKNARSKENKTALDYAMDGKFSSMIDLLTTKAPKK